MPDPADPRADRLAQALRDNLRRRKAQSRARAAARPAEPEPPGPDAPETDPGDDPA